MSDAPVLVVIGKKTVRATEIPHLVTIGKAMVARGKQLVTTVSGGAAAHVADGFKLAGGTPQYMTRGNYDRYTTDYPVICFTDARYEKHLDEIAPNWRDRDWLVLQGGPLTKEAAEFLVEFCKTQGTPIGASS